MAESLIVFSAVSKAIRIALIWLVLIFFLILLGFLPGIYVLLRLFYLPSSWFFTGTSEQALMDSVMSGLAATVFGILIGIPVALWLNGRQEAAADLKEQKQLASEEAVHQRKL